MSTVFCLLIRGTTRVRSLLTTLCLSSGDSRIVLLNFDGSPIMLTKDHKPNLPEEADRITAAGGEVVNVHGIWRVGGTLALSRAFGDPVSSSA